MKLKIGYQRKKVSQVMMKESEKLAMPGRSEIGALSTPGSGRGQLSGQAHSIRKETTAGGRSPESAKDDVLVENR
jgi:hypothetical protein